MTMSDGFDARVPTDALAGYMTRKTNIDWYRERLQVIEQEFGAKWLRKKARDVSSAHPIPRLWAEASQMLGPAERTRAMTITTELANLFDLATDLECARGLPGYSSAISSLLLKRLTFEKEGYVAHVATMGVRSEYSVSFVPVSEKSGERTPDLNMSRGDQTFDVECKRKDSYCLEGARIEAWETLELALGDLQGRLSCDYEVLVVAVGILPVGHIAEIARFVRERVGAGDEGEYSGSLRDCVVLIKRCPERPSGVDGIWVPAWQNPAVATATMRINDQGQPEYGPTLRLSLHIIDAHRLSQVLNSFRSARGQINSARSGMIFIGVDTSKVLPGDHELYFRTLEEWMRRQFTPAQHSRVAAVVLTGDIATVEITPDKGWHRSSRHWRVIRNPHYPDVDRVLIPGTPPEQRQANDQVS